VVDYLAAAKAFRAKAAATPYPEEAKTLLAKAAELEAKYGNRSSPSANDTTTTSRSGQWDYSNTEYLAWAEAIRRHRQAEAMRVAEDLLKNQWRWNREYYDQNGNPFDTGPNPNPDPDDLIAEEYKTDPEDEDYGYDIFEGEETT
jgi:hypothetical protein